MEDQLDEIENGVCTMNDVLTDFYDGFRKELDAAMENVSKEDIDVPDEVTDIECEHCGSKMVVKSGRFGKFLACPGFPECHNTKPFLEKAGVKCPKCGRKEEDGERFERIRRITGYLVGTTSRWNSGKLAELKDRVVHK